MREDIGAKFASGVEDEVLGDNDPVEVLEREVALCVEDNVLSDVDVLVGAVDEDVLVLGGVGCIGNRVLDDPLVCLSITVIGHLSSENNRL